MDGAMDCLVINCPAINCLAIDSLVNGHGDLIAQ